MPLILQGKDLPETILLFQILRYSCSLTSAYSNVFFPPLRVHISRSKPGRSNLTNQRRFTKKGIHNRRAKVVSFRGSNLFVSFLLQLGFTRRRLRVNEEFMRCRRVRRLTLLNEKAKRRYANYKMLVFSRIASGRKWARHAMGMNIQSIAVFDMIKITVLFAAEYHLHPIEIPDQSK